MTPVTLIRGDTWRRTWLFRTKSRHAADLRGADARLMVRDSVGAVVLSADLVNQYLKLDTSCGRLDLEVPFAMAEEWLGTYEFDVEVTHDSIGRLTIEQNQLIVSPDKTYSEVAP